VSDKAFVCRCEDVTRSEIERAIAAGHRDLESVKRYTGLGTGFCQGKQCVALVARLIVASGGERAEAPITPRPPIRPVPLAALVGLADATEPSEAPPDAEPEA
jgi:NAD(P)H-nitrite reductase large subunit